MLLLIDNYDSFTWNLVQRLGEIAPELPVEVYRNDQITGDEVAAKQPSYLVISPGPCTPVEAGVSCEVVRRFAGRMPILGVCLGHQAIGQVFGGQIVRAKQLMHGKVDQIEHNGAGLFTGLASPLEATRYHSLVIDPPTLPPEFEIDAWAAAPTAAVRSWRLGIAPCRSMVCSFIRKASSRRPATTSCRLSSVCRAAW